MHYSINGYTTAAIMLELEALLTTNTRLDCSSKNLGAKTTDELVTIFTAIPASVTSLGLSNDHLQQKTGDELAIAFAAIPASVTHLDFGSIAQTDLVKILHQLPKSITILTAKDHIANWLFPRIARDQFFANPLLDPEQADAMISAPIEINEELLIKLINCMQQQPTPLTELVCALLLDGKMANSVDENLLGDENYQRTRSLAALAFYRKAACDETLNPIIKSILFHECATGLSPIADVLADFNLRLSNEPIRKLNKRKRDEADQLNQAYISIFGQYDSKETLANPNQLPKKIDSIHDLLPSEPVAADLNP